MPVSGIEGGFDEVAIVGCEAEEFLGEFGPCATEIGHFNFVEGGSDGLGGEAGVFEADLFLDEVAVAPGEDVPAGVGVAEGGGAAGG